MNPITKLHHQAMEIADEAMMSYAKGMQKAAIKMYEKAYSLEKQAVEKMPVSETVPVPRPVLMRGAAALAYKAGLYNEAEEMIAACLSENPPLYVINELDEITALIKMAQKGSLQIKGKLTSANESEITVREETSSKSYSIHVPSEKLKKVVKKFFMEMVSVQATTNYKGTILLKKIGKAA